MCPLSYAALYLELDPMTLIFDLELDVPNMEIVGQGIQVLEHEQAGRHSF